MPSLLEDPDLVVGVLPDVPAVDRLLDYSVPARWAAQVRVGSVVRIPLQGRRVRGWIYELDRRPPPGVTLRAITKLSGLGPDAAMLALAEWAAWRWAGRRLSFIRAATPERAVWDLPAAPALPGSSERAALVPAQPGAAARPAVEAASLAAAAFAAAQGDGASPVQVVRWPPGLERVAFAREALRDGPALLLTPSQAEADALARALRAEGHHIARAPQDWAAGAAGATVIGSRAAVWAPVAGLRRVVVFDEHDERYQDERLPTWHARDVAVERARRAGAPVLLVSPLPSLEAAQAGPLWVPSRASERDGWPLTTVVDRRELDPREGLYSAEVIDALRSDRTVIVVHNRTGRAKLLACTRCGELCRCDECGAAMQSTSRRGATTGTAVLRCAAAGHERPEVCSACGATRLAVLRPGVGRVREDIEALVGEPVGEVSAAGTTVSDRSVTEDGGGDRSPPAADPRVWVGTEAVLHRVRRAGTVIVLDLDQELLAPRFRAAERTLALLALAGRVVGGRRRDGRLVVQTRQPDHEVVQAVVHAEPSRWAEPEGARRRQLGLPPFNAVALIEGEGAEEFVTSLAAETALQIQGPTEGRYLVRAPASAALADALMQVQRPLARLRIVVDPPAI